MRWLVPALLSCALLATAMAQAAEIQTVTLANGLRLILAPDDRAAAVDVAVWYDSGSRSERPGQSGIAHLFEHMMFRGSSQFAAREHNRLLQSQGGSTGAYTTGDFTCFFQTLPAEALELALRLEADRMATLRVTQDNLDGERQAVEVERTRRFEATPLGRGLATLYANAFADHPYRWPVLGRPSDLASLTLKDAQSWYRSRYATQRTIVTVVGRFDPVDVVAWARRSFEPIPRGPAAAAPSTKLPAQTRERRASDRTEFEIPVVLVGWRGPAHGEADLAALQLISIALTRGESARLRSALVRGEGTLMFAEGDLDSRRDAALLYVVGGANPRADTAVVESQLLAQVQKLIDQPLPAAELERAKRMAESALLFGMQTTRGRAQSIGSAVMLGGIPDDAMRQVERIRSLTAADVQGAAARTLIPARRTVVWLRPSAASGAAPGGGGRP